MNRNRNKTYFIKQKTTINTNTIVQVNKSIYDAYFQTIWVARARSKRNGECSAIKWELLNCDGDCSVCKYFKPVKAVSLDSLINNDEDYTSHIDLIADPSSQPEEEYILKERKAAINNSIKRLEKKDQLICKYIMDGKSYREIAKIMGIPYSTFFRHWRKLQARLQKDLKDYQN